VAAAEETYYSSGTEKAKTAVEGLFRGASLGATDYLFGDDQTKARARYNPGTAMGTEIVGALAPLLLSGGASAPESAGALARVAGAAPTSLVARGAKAITSGVENRFARSALTGAIEGGVLGGAQAADHAYLAGDPITAEAVLHGAGWGAVFGAGASSIGEGVAVLGERAVMRQAERLAPKTVLNPGRESFVALKSEISNLSEKLGSAVQAADSVVAGVTKQLNKVREVPGLAAEELVALKGAVNSATRRVNKAVLGGNSDKITEAVRQYEAVSGVVTEKFGLPAFETGKAMQELVAAKATKQALFAFPKTLDEFAAMTPKKAEKVFAAMEQAKTLSAFPELGAAAETAANGLSNSLGLVSEGVTGLRKAWGVAKEATKVERRAAVESLAPKADTAGSGLSLVGPSAVYHVTRGLTGSRAAGGVASALWVAGRNLGALRNQVVGRIQAAAAKYAPKASRVVKAAGPRVEPLSVKLDGTLDESKRPREELAAARVKEFWDAYPTINDRGYLAVGPLGVTQPELGPAVHKAFVGAFSEVMKDLPRDPGVVSGLKSIWKPSSLQAETLARRLAVFHDPVGQAEQMLESGQFDPIKIKTLRAVAPAIWQELRVSTLERLSEPGVMESLSYEDQIGAGTMLDINIHSSMRPEHIASSLQLFQSRNQPMPSPTPVLRTGGVNNGGGAGRPAANSPQATQAQKITDR
jgi:hypothetical protein